MQQIIQHRPSVPVDTFLPDVNFITDNTMPPDVAKLRILNALRMFCEDSGVIKRSITIKRQDCVNTYPICFGDELGIRAEPALCAQVTRETVQFDEQAQRVELSNCVDRDRYEPISRGSLCKPKDLKLTFVVKPKLDACEVDAALLEQHYECVLNYIEYVLHKMKDVPWSDGAKAGTALTLGKRCATSLGVDKFVGGMSGTIKLKRRNYL